MKTKLYAFYLQFYNIFIKFHNLNKLKTTFLNEYLRNKFVFKTFKC